MNTMKILITSYKENSTDMCMGCIMDRFDSDHTVEVYENISSASDHLARLDSIEFAPSESKYEHKIFIFETSDDPKIIEENILYETRDKTKQIIEERKKQKEEKLKIEKELQKKATKEKDLAQFEILKKKLGIQTD